MDNYLHAMVNIDYTIRQAIPKVTEQKGSQTKLKCLNHIAYYINLKHTAQSKRKEME